MEENSELNRKKLSFVPNLSSIHFSSTVNFTHHVEHECTILF
jgi:hypothetical protein